LVDYESILGTYNYVFSFKPHLEAEDDFLLKKKTATFPM
jgi:hypothetical protein